LHGRAGGWPHSLKPNSDGTPSKHATPAKIETMSYYDTLNFAKRLKVPGHYTWGYNDEATPPTSTFAAFNVITAPKDLTIQLQQGHQYPPEQDADIDHWLAAFLGWE
jgi:cephalosporin-C deacetylase-like acetyl esterase